MMTEKDKLLQQLAEYLLESEEADYLEQIREGSNVDLLETYHVYAVAKRAMDLLNEEMRTL